MFPVMFYKLRTCRDNANSTDFLFFRISFEFLFLNLSFLQLKKIIIIIIIIIIKLKIFTKISQMMLLNGLTYQTIVKMIINSF